MPLCICHYQDAKHPPAEYQMADPPLYIRETIWPPMGFPYTGEDLPLAAPVCGIRTFQLAARIHGGTVWLYLETE